MDNKKYFIITVDTEGDNLWNYREGDLVGTKNADYIPRFQRLCEKYSLKPVYLTNYEMALSDSFVKSAKEWLSKGTCEIGVHLHAWNTPPYYKLSGPYKGNPYLIEYPIDIMKSKFEVIYNLIVDRFGITPISHRAGRWAMDDRYFKILEDFGILVDCSYTPGINWSNNKGITIGGSDYSKEKLKPYYINSVLEMPVSVCNTYLSQRGSLKHRIKVLFSGEKIWLRPATNSAKEMCKVLDKLIKKTDVDYVEFMIHSSELMPGGSPYFMDDDAIDEEFAIMEEVFKYASELGYLGSTFVEYINIKKNRYV